MPMTPFRVRATEPGNCAPVLREGTGGRLMYGFGLLIDAKMEMTLQGVNAHMPASSGYMRQHVAPADALAQIGSGYDMPRGLTESDASYGGRLQGVFDAKRLGGTTRGVLSQVLGYLLAFTPLARWVQTRYQGPRSVDSALLSTIWDSYPVGRPLDVEPVRVYTEGPNGILDWDSASHVDGSNGWWGAWLVLYPVGAQAFVGPAQAWGVGSTYTPAGDGYYSTTSAGAYVLAGSYVGTSQAWGEGSTYTASASGYYSTTSGGAYVAAGSYTGYSQAWGVDVDARIGLSIAGLVKQQKGANTWVRGILFSFNASLFDPTQPVGGGINPDGDQGQWSGTSGGAYVETRFSDVAYGPEVT